MTTKEMAERINNDSARFNARTRYSNQIEAKVASDQLLNLLYYLKTAGFEHLSCVSCVDWLERDLFEIVYNLWSYSHKIHATVKTTVDRKEPSLATALSLWPQAQVYEQEIHEFFGVEFNGNPDLKPFFLHNWQDIPPLRKDFDTESYVKAAYGTLEEEDGSELSI